MARQVMQCMCPGCKMVLRLPAEWADQPIRCKGCGTAMQAKRPAPAVSPSRPTPPPPPRAAAPPAAIKAAPPTPPPPPVAVKAGALAITAPVVPPPAPLAQPVTPKQKPGQSFAFDAPEDEGDRKARSIRKPRAKGGMGYLITIGVMLLFFAVTAGIVAANWQRIKAYAIAPTTPDGDDRPRPVAKTKEKERPKDKGKPVAVGKAGFPRRALIISVHNYLYMNPITSPYEPKGDAGPLARSLSTGLNVPLNQIVELSDQHNKKARPPLKNVIEETIKNFLGTCRKQDRVIVGFAGHTHEAEGKAYLIPLEGERESPDTLIPVAWVMDRLAKADVRQKVFILDGHRNNAGQGQERPTSGDMTEAFEKAISTPPAGVQVWAACSKGQASHEFEEAPLGLFLDSFRGSLTTEKGGEKAALAGRIQQPDELIPMEVFRDNVNKRMAADLHGVKQASLLFGKEPDTGADYDKDEPAAKLPALPVVAGANAKEVGELLSEISLPSLKGVEGSAADLSFGGLPPFPADVMKKYGGTLPADHPLRAAVHKARARLWAISRSTIPPDLADSVAEVRKKLSVDLGILRDKYTKPAGGGPIENAYKARFKDQSKDLSRIVALLETTLDELKAAGKEKDDAPPPRWQANYDYILARVQAQLAYLEEYNSLMGQMQKELPAIEAIHSGWRVSSKEKAGDPAGKKYDRAARTLYAKVAEGNAKTPWEVIAKREKLTALGLEWAAY